MKVVIDGVAYVPQSEPEQKALRLVAEVYGRLWVEAYYDPENEITRAFAQPLVKLMAEANAVLHFKV